MYNKGTNKRKEVTNMKYKLNDGREINIPDDELANSMEKLELTKDEAIQLYLEDNDYEINAEQQELDEKAKKVKVNHDAKSTKARKKSDKPRTVKVSDTKKDIFQNLQSFLTDYCANLNGNLEILKENKLFELTIGDKKFKVDLIEERAKKG